MPELDRRALIIRALASLGAAGIPAEALAALAPTPEFSIKIEYIRSPLWREMFEALCVTYFEITGDVPEPGTYGYELCSVLTDGNYEWYNRIMYGNPDSPLQGLLGVTTT